MTRLVVDPVHLATRFSDASVSLPTRVRLIVQVVNYDDSTALLHCCRLPAVEGADDASGLFTASVRNVVGLLKPESVYGGSIVGLLGFWDGVELNVVECQPIEGGSIKGDLLKVIADLDPI